MPTRIRHLWLWLLAAALIVAAAAFSAPAPAPRLLAAADAPALPEPLEQSGAAAAAEQAAPSFGPMLFLISRPEGSERPALPPGAALHTRLAGPEGDRYLASGPADAPAAAALSVAAAGGRVETLDADTAGKAYYLADAQESGAAETAQAAGGAVLYSGAGTLVIAVPTASELALVETLGAAGVPFGLLAPDPLPYVPEEEMEQAAAAAAPLQAPNPSTQALLARWDVNALRARISELSGETPVNIGGSTVTIHTRNTFSTRIRDAERYLYQYYQSLGIPVSYHNWTYGSYSGRNVIAELRGRTNPQRIWLVGGHHDGRNEGLYDSSGRAPAADDNASGIAATMLIASILRNTAPGDTIRFVHFSGEEQGHWGSIVYARGVRAAGEQIAGYIDLDMIGYDGNRDRVLEIHTGSLSGFPNSNRIGTAFISAADLYGQGLTIERKSSTASTFSDHNSFWNQNYPAFLVIENFFDDVSQYGRARDRNPCYHRTCDTLAGVDLDYVTRIGRTALAMLADSAGVTGGGAPPTATPTRTPTRTPLPTATTPVRCQEVLLNGGMETATAWRFGPTPFPAAYVTTFAHSGARSARLGVPPGSRNTYAYSTIYQTITLPAGADSITLRYWQRPGGPADGVDYREALLLNTSYGTVARLERSYAAGNDQWQQKSFDLTGYAGRTLVLYFNVYNSGGGSAMYGYLDDVSVQSCSDNGASGTIPLELETPMYLPDIRLGGTPQP